MNFIYFTASISAMQAEDFDIVTASNVADEENKEEMKCEGGDITLPIITEDVAPAAKKIKLEEE